MYCARIKIIFAQFIDFDPQWNEMNEEKRNIKYRLRAKWGVRCLTLIKVEIKGKTWIQDSVVDP